MISADSLLEFRHLYIEEFGSDPSDEETARIARDLVELLRILCRTPK